jgi:hypothetical protein
LLKKNNFDMQRQFLTHFLFTSNIKYTIIKQNIKKIMTTTAINTKKPNFFYSDLDTSLLTSQVARIGCRKLYEIAAPSFLHPLASFSYWFVRAWQMGNVYRMIPNPENKRMQVAKALAPPLLLIASHYIPLARPIHRAFNFLGVASVAAPKLYTCVRHLFTCLRRRDAKDAGRALTGCLIHTSNLVLQWYRHSNLPPSPQQPAAPSA